MLMASRRIWNACSEKGNKRPSGSVHNDTVTRELEIKRMSDCNDDDHKGRSGHELSCLPSPSKERWERVLSKVRRANAKARARRIV
jgi:hypothetical protein